MLLAALHSGRMTPGDLVMIQGLVFQLWTPLQFLGWFYRRAALRPTFWVAAVLCPCLLQPYNSYRDRAPPVAFCPAMRMRFLRFIQNSGIED